MVCSDDELTRRLSSRPASRNFGQLETMLACNRQLREGALQTTLPIQILGTTDWAVFDSARDVRQWICDPLLP